MKSLQFEASIDDSVIEVGKTARDRPGTTIRVNIDGPTFSQLTKNGGGAWNWYGWNVPRVERCINGETLSNVSWLPVPGTDL